jgi:hypothetical protein
MTLPAFRSRWAAIGAAVAVCLGAGGIGISQATTSSGEMPIYQPIEPCRLADTRPDFLVGTRATPIAADEAYTLSGWGTVGQCTLPNGSTALSLNVTAVDATQGTFLTLYPADATRPNASHLNPAPGQPPTPNAVNVDLDTSGEFKIFNKAGTVHVIIDVVGYYDDHIHRSADLVDEPGVAYSFSSDLVTATSTPTSMGSTTIRVPANGYVAIEVTGNWKPGTAGQDGAECQLQKGTAVAIDKTEPWFYVDDRNAGITNLSLFSAHRVMPISSADNPPIFNAGQAIRLTCAKYAGAVSFYDLHISATYYATSYAPKTITTIPPIVTLP